MTLERTILLTGFTGILGKRFAYRLAALGYDVVCPIRAGSEAEARDRFQGVFHGLHGCLPGFDESLAARIRPVPGDVRRKDLGLPASILADLRGPRVKGIWHLAALLDLTETKSQDVYDTNLMGTLNVLELARSHGIGELHYFSTFGSSGKLHEGVVREIPGIRPPSFRNTYERTKWEAERHVWGAQIRGEVTATIYRPSIVVGDSILGRYEQFNVFNHPFDITSRVRTKLCEKQGIDPKSGTLRYDLRIPGSEKATLNIVPLDFVMDTVMKIYSVPGSMGRVYHIVNPDPPSLRLTMEIFKKNEPWEGLKWEVFGPDTPFANPYEKFIGKQLGFLTPYLLGEAVYDYSNVQAVLAFHGGIPPLKNDIFLDAISKRGIREGWQEVRSDAEMAAIASKRGQLDSGFVWPEGAGPVVDFSPHHPVVSSPPPASAYSVAERFLGKAYSVRERIFAGVQVGGGARDAGARDIVLIPFGMGVTRRGEGETHCYQHNPELADQVFAQLNQVCGFDLRAFSQGPVRGHEAVGDIHDDCCWAVADDLIHLVRMFREIQEAGGVDLLSRLQILPHSGGTYLAGWMSGVVSFLDMGLMAHQCAHFMSEGVRLATLSEVEKWFFNKREKLSEEERQLLRQVREKVDAALNAPLQALADKLHGNLELVFSLNAAVLNQLISDVREHRITVSPAITMSPNSAVFAGNAMEMARFRKLFVGKRKIELRRVSLEVRGTPHFQRLREAGRHTADLLQLYMRQGRLRDPVVPVISNNGEPVRTCKDFVDSVAAIADRTLYFDRMIEHALEQGGRHFVMVQSGTSSTAGDLFDGIVRSHANLKGIKSVQVHRPATRPGERHPICDLLEKRDKARVRGAAEQPLLETIRWYESQLSEASTAVAGPARGTVSRPS